MPNSPSPFKRVLNLLIERETIKKLDTMSEMTGLSRNSLACAILEEGTKSILLNDKAREELKNEIENAKRN